MKKPDKKNPFKYYLVGTQIAITVFIAVFAGYQLDVFLNTSSNIIAILFAIISIFYSLYVLVYRVTKEK